jgi:hypothetical protein
MHIAIPVKTAISFACSMSSRLAIAARTAIPLQDIVGASGGRPQAAPRSPAETAIPFAYPRPSQFQIPAETATSLGHRRGACRMAPLAPQGEGPGVRPLIAADSAIPLLLRDNSAHPACSALSAFPPFRAEMAAMRPTAHEFATKTLRACEKAVENGNAAASPLSPAITAIPLSSVLCETSVSSAYSV